MPECALCGKTVPELVEIELEGTVVGVCNDCKRFGRVIETKIYKPMGKKLDLSKIGPDEDVRTVPDYGMRVKHARESKGLKIKEFARKINERESVIRRIESQSLEPDDALTKKLEKSLKIKLKEKYE